MHVLTTEEVAKIHSFSDPSTDEHETCAGNKVDQANLGVDVHNNLTINNNNNNSSSNFNINMQNNININIHYKPA